MADLEGPQGIDMFAEGLSTFEHEQVINQEQPTAAVQSASLDINKPQTTKKVTIVEPAVKTDEEEESIVDKLKDFYEENQTMILASLVIGSIGFYMYKKKQK